MAIEIKMPALSPTMESGTLAKWLVDEGADVRSGDVIAEIETDKATMEVEAVDDGKLGKILVAAGTENVAVNAPIAILLEDGDAADATPTNRSTSAETPSASAPSDAATAETASVSSIAPAAPTIMAETEWTGASTSITVRESLRDAMAEEMRRDANVF
ncbi:MAG: biotin/lipoyl-binding protein, partial [Candidatus Puniceispirillum sp.]|nr:biotin/lipoyl-binding protein [Candidatus Puniceispirillum sp.]